MSKTIVIVCIVLSSLFSFGVSAKNIYSEYYFVKAGRDYVPVPVTFGVNLEEKNNVFSFSINRYIVNRKLELERGGRDISSITIGKNTGKWSIDNTVADADNANVEKHCDIDVYFLEHKFDSFDGSPVLTRSVYIDLGEWFYSMNGVDSDTQGAVIKIIDTLRKCFIVLE